MLLQLDMLTEMIYVHVFVFRSSISLCFFIITLFHNLTTGIYVIFTWFECCLSLKIKIPKMSCLLSEFSQFGHTRQASTFYFHCACRSAEAKCKKNKDQYKNTSFHLCLLVHHSHYFNQKAAAESRWEWARSPWGYFRINWCLARSVS